MRVFLIVLTLVLASSGAATAASVPSPDAAGRGDYTLQVATYQDRAHAERVSSEIPEAWVEEVRIEGRILFRVNYKRFRERTQALAAQWDLEDLGYEGFIQKIYT